MMYEVMFIRFSPYLVFFVFATQVYRYLSPRELWYEDLVVNAPFVLLVTGFCWVRIEHYHAGWKMFYLIGPQHVAFLGIVSFCVWLVLREAFSKGMPIKKSHLGKLKLTSLVLLVIAVFWFPLDLIFDGGFFW